MYGAIIAFKDYSPALGIMESPWVGFKHFKEKVKAAEIADRVKDSRETFRAEHSLEMKNPMTKQEMENKKQAFKALYKYKS